MLRNGVESSLGPFNLSYWISDSSVAVIEYHDQDDLQKEKFIWDYNSEGRILNRQREVAARGQKRKLRDCSFQSPQAKRELEMRGDINSVPISVDSLRPARWHYLPKQHGQVGIKSTNICTTVVYFYSNHHTYLHRIYMYLKEISIFFYILFCLWISLSLSSSPPLPLLLFPSLCFLFLWSFLVLTFRTTHWGPA